MGCDSAPVRPQQGQTLGTGGWAATAQGGVTLHLAQRHAGGFQPVYECDPGQDRRVIVALTRPVTVGAR